MNTLGRKLIEMGLLEDGPPGFEVFLTHLRVFVAEQGHCKVPSKYVCADGFNLGQKVHHLRQSTPKISARQRAELKALGFIWKYRAWWYAKFIKHLKVFVAKHGHARVPTKYTCRDGFKLGSKVNTIRTGLTKITEEQRAELDAIGFVWDGKDWYSLLLEKLTKFKAENGHCKVPSKYVCADGFRLGQLIQCIRGGKTHSLTDEQRAELDAIGFVWAERGSAVWFPPLLERLAKFRAEHGHCKVPAKYACADGYKLGHRVAEIREGGRKLTEEQRTALDAIGFVWAVKGPTVWYPPFLAGLTKFKAENGHLAVPVGHPLRLLANRIRGGRAKPTEAQRAELATLGLPLNARPAWGAR